MSGQENKDSFLRVSIFFNKILSKEFNELFTSGKIEVLFRKEILREISRVFEYPKIKGILERAEVSSREVIEEITRISRVQ